MGLLDRARATGYRTVAPTVADSATSFGGDSQTPVAVGIGVGVGGHGVYGFAVAGLLCRHNVVASGGPGQWSKCGCGGMAVVSVPGGRGVDQPGGACRAAVGA